MKTNFPSASRSAQSRILKRLTSGLSYCLSLASVVAISAEAIAQPISLDAIAQHQTVATQITQKQTVQKQAAQTQIA